MEVRIFVEKWNIYESHIFAISLVQTCRLETTTLCLYTRLRVKKNFNFINILIIINVNVWLLCAHLVMTSIILRTRRTTCQYKVCYALQFYVPADFLFFAFWRFEKPVLHIFPFRPTSYVLIRFRGLEVRNRVKKLYYVKYFIYVES